MERASTWSNSRRGTNINNVPLSWPDSFFCLVAEEKRGEENTHTDSRQRQLENEGQQAPSVLHCKLSAPHKGLVIVRPPPPLLLLSPTLLQWDKG